MVKMRLKLSQLQAKLKLELKLSLAKVKTNENRDISNLVDIKVVDFKHFEIGSDTKTITAKEPSATMKTSPTAAPQTTTTTTKKTITKKPVTRNTQITTTVTTTIKTRTTKKTIKTRPTKKTATAMTDDDICAPVAKDPERFNRADPNNRCKFFSCQQLPNGGWKANSMDCPAGTIWDEKLGNCNHGTCNI